MRGERRRTGPRDTARQEVWVSPVDGVPWPLLRRVPVGQRVLLLALESHQGIICTGGLDKGAL